MTALFKKIDKAVQEILRLLTIALFVVLALILLLNVLLRLSNDCANFLASIGLSSAPALLKAILPITSMHWFDEIVEMCFAALVFYGAAALWAVKGHFSVGDWISPRLPGYFSCAFYRLVVTLLNVLFVGVFFWFSLKLCLRSTELTTVFQIPKKILYSCMPISSLIMLSYSLADLFVDVQNLFARNEATQLHRQAQETQSM